MTRPHIEPYVELNEDYKPFRIPGFGGSDFKTLSLDPDTGACSLKVRFNNGYKRKPGLSYSDMELFVLGCKDVVPGADGLSNCRRCRVS